MFQGTVLFVHNCDIEIQWRKTNIAFCVSWCSPTPCLGPTHRPSPSIPYTVHVRNNAAGAARVTRFASEERGLWKRSFRVQSASPLTMPHKRNLSRRSLQLMTKRKKYSMTVGLHSSHDRLQISVAWLLSMAYTLWFLITTYRGWSNHSIKVITLQFHSELFL